MSFLIGVLSIFGLLYMPQWLGWRWGYLDGRRSKAAVAIGIMFMVSGTTHFTNPAGFVAMMPPFLPEPLLMVYLSGMAEIALGMGLLWPRLRPWAGAGAIFLLLAIFPANIYAAVNGVISPNAPDSPLYLWLRLPLQFVYIALVWWSAAVGALLASRRPQLLTGK